MMGSSQHAGASSGRCVESDLVESDLKVFADGGCCGPSASPRRGKAKVADSAWSYSLRALRTINIRQSHQSVSGDQ